MEINTAFRILEIEFTKDEAIIAEAYRSLLPKYNPEDDAEGFKNLRLAYETALNYARTRDTEEDSKEPVTEVDVWMKKVETLYQDILSRGDEGKWRKLLEDDCCIGLDTSIDARNKILIFLMDNFYLPHKIWKEIADTFQIIEDYSELEKEFPTDFLDYVKYNAENKGFLPYELFEYISIDGEHAKPDNYIKGLLGIINRIDNDKLDNCLEELDNLKDYDIYHPYEDVERLKLYIKLLEQENTENKDEIKENARKLIDKLSELPTEYTYAYTYIGEIMWCLGQKEEAYSIWQSVLEEYPKSYHAKFCVTRYLYDKGSYEDASKMAQELVQINDADENLRKLVIKINDVLIEMYKKQVESGEENTAHPGQDLLLELGWKLWQNERKDEAIALLESFTPDESCEYGYNNLFGRLLYHNKEYERALKYLKRWNEMLSNLDGLEPDEKKKRLRRRPMSYCYMAACMFEIKEYADAEENVKQAINNAEVTSDRLEYMQQYASMLLKWKRYNDAVDICDDIVKIDNQYYPAYLIHQEACFKLKKGQEVIDDYRKAIRLFDGYYKPYLYAAMIYYNYRQYHDGMSVLNEARNSGIAFTLRMRFLEIQLQRYLVQDGDEGEKLFKALNDIEEKLKSEKSENSENSEETEDSVNKKPDLDEIYCERAFLYQDNNDYNMANTEIDKAIREADKARYYLIKGDILSDDNNERDNSRFSEAVTIYRKAEALGMKDNPWLYYSLGYCCERLGNMETAVEYYKKALDIRAPYENICKRLVDYYLDRYTDTYKKEYYDNAMAYADMELSFRENEYSLWLKARVYECGAEFEKAVEFYERAVKEYEKVENPVNDSFIVWYQLGNCYRRLMQYDKAIMCLETSIKKLNGRKRVQPYWHLAICYESMLNYDKAIDYYKQALEFSDYKEEIWQRIGDCYLYMEQFDEAISAYKKADKADINANIAEVLFAKGEYKNSEKYYKKSVLNVPKENLDFKYILLGDYYLEYLQDYKKAIGCYVNSANINGSDYNLLRTNVDLIKARYLSGKNMMAKLDAKCALNVFKNAYKISEEEYLLAAPYRAIELYRFGWIYLGLGMFEKAKRYFKQMEEVPLCKNCRHKGCYEARLYLGIIYLTQGDKKKAREAFEEALRRNPHDQFSKQMLKKAKK